LEDELVRGINNPPYLPRIMKIKREKISNPL